MQDNFAYARIEALEEALATKTQEMEYFKKSIAMHLKNIPHQAACPKETIDSIDKIVGLCQKR